MRRSSFLLLAWSLGSLLALLSLFVSPPPVPKLNLPLTDLALFTEAAYTRHRSLATPQSAFTEFPLGLDLLPTGSLVPPP